MILLLVVAACFATVPLAGGRLSRLAEIDIRGVHLIALALALQVTVAVAAAGDRLASTVHLASYGLAGAAVWLNRRLPGVRLIALGGALNLAAIAANGGVMPASPQALEAAGVPPAEGFANSDVVEDPKLAALGDVIPVPGPDWMANVLSIGDLVLFAGALVFLHCATRDRSPIASGGRGGRA